jgi:cobaltochelatase CobS
MADNLSMAELNAMWLDVSDEILSQVLKGNLPNPQKVSESEARLAEAETTQTTQPVQGPSLEDAKALLDIFNRARGGKAELDESRVIELIGKHAPKAEPYIKGFEFKTEKATFKTEGRQHAYFPLIVASLLAKQHLWIVGPAGGGKTSLVSVAAQSLSLEHRAISVCGQTTKTDFLGFIDANGVYRGTAFREAFEFGHVFNVDEADNGNANVLAVLNAALANGEMTFPDKTVKRHPNFVCIACANTFGNGATSQYVGRNPIDAATLDRFFFVQLPYDEGLEASFVGIEGVPSPAFNLSEGGSIDTLAWFSMVKTARSNAEKAGIKAVVSPRATIAGAKLAALGVGKAWLVKGLLVKSLDSVSAGKLGIA